MKSEVMFRSSLSISRSRSKNETDLSVYVVSLFSSSVGIDVINTIT